MIKKQTWMTYTSYVPIPSHMHQGITISSHQRNISAVQYTLREKNPQIIFCLKALFFDFDLRLKSHVSYMDMAPIIVQNHHLHLQHSSL